MLLALAIGILKLLKSFGNFNRLDKGKLIVNYYLKAKKLVK